MANGNRGNRQGNFRGGNSGGRGQQNQQDDDFDDDDQQGGSFRGRTGGSQGNFRGQGMGIVDHIDDTIDKLTAAREALVGYGMEGYDSNDQQDDGEDYDEDEGSKSGGRSQPAKSGRGSGARNMDGSTDQRQFNQGRRNFSGGSGNQNDERTKAGREAHDADDFSEDDLYDMLDNPDDEFTNEDGSFDRRKKQGRALYAAGLIDEAGHPIQQQSRGRGGQQSGGNRGGNRSGSRGGSGGNRSR